jgi:hypothetical protein
MLAPNSQSSLSESATTTKTVVKNKERSYLETSYQSDYSNSEGLGSHVVFDTTATLAPTEQLVSSLCFNYSGRKKKQSLVFSFSQTSRNPIFRRHSIRLNPWKECK